MASEITPSAEEALRQLTQVVQACLETGDADVAAGVSESVITLTDALKQKYAGKIVDVLLKQTGSNPASVNKTVKKSSPLSREIAPPSEGAISIASVCRETRIRLGLSVTALAQRAHVSNRSVSTAECVEQGTAAQKPLYAILQVASVRQKRAWVRILIRIAKALDLPTDRFLGDFQKMANVTFDATEIETLIQSAT